MKTTFEFQITAPYALFSDPLTKVGGEHISLPFPTYEALKGVLKSVYFKPTILWVIDDLRIMNPIQTMTRGVKIPNYEKPGNDLAYYTYLKDVQYQVRAHFIWNMNRPELECDRIIGKHYKIIKRMIERGGRRDVFLGTRECQALVEPCVFGSGQGFYDNQPWETAYGFLYHSLIYPDEAILEDDKGWLTTTFWHPVMKNGMIHYIRPEECTEKRHVREMGMKTFNSNNCSGISEFQEGFDEVG